MLPTQRAENCIITNNGTVKKGIYYHKALLTQQYLKSICQESHHLYIITDDIIQDKDWCLFFDSNGNLFCNEPQQYLVKEGHVLNDGLKKVIATTDRKLPLKEFEGSIHYKMFPNLSAGFIQAYTDSDGNITNIQVEYHLNYINKSGYNTCKGCNKDFKQFPNGEHDEHWHPKLKDDNTIIIHQAKTYTLEDMREAFKAGDMFRDKHVDEYEDMEGNYPCYDIIDEAQALARGAVPFDKWIENK